MSHTVEFANFTLKFGDENLVDYLAEIVLPAFFDSQPKTNIRFGTTTMFQNVSITTLRVDGRSVYAITGRFIKSMLIKRTQYLDERNVLRKDEGSMYSAPSGVFTLTLEDHMLVYVRETDGAPGLEAFENFVQRNLKIKHNAYIRKIHQEKEQELADGMIDKRITYREIISQHPVPDLNVVYLSNPGTLREFVERFSKLKKIEAKISDTNHGVDDDTFFEEIRRRKNKVGAKRTTYAHVNNEEGLDKAEAADEMSSAHSGNAVVSLEGLDRDGNRLEGDNRDFRVQTKIENLGQTVPETARVGYAAFQSLLGNGSLQILPTPPSQLRRARDIIERETDEYRSRRG